MNASDLHLLPLGGTGEIGMNLNLYHHRGRWLVVDCGVMFERDGVADQHAVFPDISFAEAHRHRIEGLVLTHAHQDHLGAVRDLWPRLRCRVFATPFAAAMLEEPLREAGLLHRVPLRVISETGRIPLGPFDVERVPLTHSIPEMGALAIRTPVGTVVHTGDFKLDPEPVLGRRTARGTLQRLGEAGVLACVSDSTNADLEGWTGSEGSVEAGLADAIAAVRGRVAVALFATNVARLDTLCRIASRLGRHPILLGRSVERTVRAAREAGYLRDLPPLVPARDLGFIPPERVLLLCTGSQGEPRAALTRIAEGTHPHAYLEPGDAVLFSSRRIPGNELWIERVERLLREAGIGVITAEEAPIHVSGHPRRDELRELYRWLQPRHVVPVHGTPPKLDAHAALAHELGIEPCRIRNGDVLKLGPGAPEVVRRVRTGRQRRVEAPRGAAR